LVLLILIIFILVGGLAKALVLGWANYGLLNISCGPRMHNAHF